MQIKTTRQEKINIIQKINFSRRQGVKKAEKAEVAREVKMGARKQGEGRKKGAKTFYFI